MRDYEFKNLNHYCAGYEIILNGGELSKGYKPDVVLQNKQNYIILESEHSSSRKHIMGGMMKAARFLTNNKHGVLVVVIQIKKNTNVDQIQKHLIQYLDWIKNITNLRDVYIISDIDYCNGSDETPIELLKARFKALSVKV